MNATQLAALTRFDASQGPRKVGPTDGHYAELGGCDARFLVWGEESGGGFALIELLIALTIMNIGLLAVVAAFSSGIFAINRASHVATASTLADSQMEIYRALSYDWIGLDTSAVTDPVYRSDTACTGGGTCQNISAVGGGCAAGGAVRSSFPNACLPTRTLSGPDRHGYRIDTYVRILPPVDTPPARRERKNVTIVVRDGSVTTRVLAREESVFDCMVSASGSTCPS